MTAPGIVFGELGGALDGSRHAAGAGRQLQLGAEVREDLAPLDRHRLRHDEDQPVAARGGDEREADAGVAGGRLDQHRAAGLDAALASSVSIIATPMRSLTDDSGLKNSSFSRMSALHLGGGGDLRQPHQRRMSDGLGNAIINAAASPRLGGGKGFDLGNVVHRGVPRMHAGRALRQLKSAAARHVGRKPFAVKACRCSPFAGGRLC